MMVECSLSLEVCKLKNWSDSSVDHIAMSS